MKQKGYLQFAAVAAFLTVLTTLGVHFIEFNAQTFEQRLLLARDSLYLAQKWMIIAHCLLVIISMFGIATILWTNNKALAALGALFFSVFGFAEITRMLSVLSYLNPLRERYLAATDDSTRQLIKFSMDNWSLAATVMFLLFILAFSLGNLCFGLAMAGKKGLDKWLAMGFLLWGLFTLLAFGNSFWSNTGLGYFVDTFNKFFQPAIRTCIGLWLWQKAMHGAHN